MYLFGAERLAEYAANAVADYHLTVGNAVGEKKLVEAFAQAHRKRLGGRKQALFAGGCFWCMAKPYYKYDGIIKVLSGYAGGSEINPTYEEVKSGLTHHKETVMLEYDSDVIGFKELLDIYFDTIDPFDEYGQFIDRGDNYTCAIFTDDAEERKTVTDYIANIERQFERKVHVKILDNQVFYKAEEYHQDYALKNPEAYAEEERISGRLEHARSKPHKKQ
ncbi:MAG: peptide-methionine (S)-S-oxide reductase MsrA [Clostridiales bacterium]|nr:peptide-methionine (S)-S-oxide reductase MsrA [Clostridiales bacterium]